MPITEARARANKKYSEKFETIYLRVLPEQKDRLAAYAKANKESVNAFVLRAINAMMDKDLHEE